MFKQPPERRIGEIWFLGDRALPCLAKYLFTSERVSLQVHPDDQQAQERGFGTGKGECLFILEAEANATIGVGFLSDVTREELRSAALKGSVAELIDWRQVTPGDFFYVPPGTVHAVGGGVTLLEFEQNSDVTYRIHDFGRARELHIEDAIQVVDLSSYPDAFFKQVKPVDECALVDGPLFTVVHAHSDSLLDRKRWILPLDGTVRLGGEIAGPGECLLAEAGQHAESEGARLLIGAES